MTDQDETDHPSRHEDVAPEEATEGGEVTPFQATVPEEPTRPDDVSPPGLEQPPAQPEPATEASGTDGSQLTGDLPADEEQVQVEKVTEAVAVVGEKRVTSRATPRSTTRKAPAGAAAKPARAAAKKTTDATTPSVVTPLRPTTLSIDIGGTGLKASVLDAEGKLVADRVRVLTPHPCSTKALVDTLATLVAPLPLFDRVSVGFPGVVRKGIIVTAPHLVSRHGTPKSPVVPKLLAEWTGFDLATALRERFGRPVRIANDADLQGLDVVSGSGLEFVVTLGTGVGTALLLDGKLAPHLELAHHPFRKGEEYDEQLGDATLRRIGFKKWHKRLEEALGNFQRLINYDRLYIGGGNARLLVGHLDPSVTIVDNLAGILGGIKLWELADH
jgi:polyphosphate glucokinase